MNNMHTFEEDESVKEAFKLIRKLGSKSKLKYYDWEWCNSDEGILVLVYWNSLDPEILCNLLGKFEGLKMRLEGGRHYNSKTSHQVALVIDLPKEEEE